jgi:hypothetical protein
MDKITVNLDGKPVELFTGIIYHMKFDASRAQGEYSIVIDHVTPYEVLGYSINTKHGTEWDWSENPEEFKNLNFTEITEIGPKEDYPEYFI